MSATRSRLRRMAVSLPRTWPPPAEFPTNMRRFVARVPPRDAGFSFAPLRFSEPVPQRVPQHAQHQCRPAPQRAAGKTSLVDACEQIEALGRAGKPLGDELARERGDSHTLAGIALGEKDI